MIVDKLCHLSNYTGLNPNLDKAIRWLGQFKSETAFEGHEKIDGENVYCNCGCQATRKREDADYEAHRKYIDIHVCLGGRERILVAPQKELTCLSEYDAEKDILWLEGKDKWDITLKTGEFLICFPEDAHVPLLDDGEEGKVNKMVVKAAI